MRVTGRAPLHVAATGTIAAVLAAIVLIADQTSKNVALAELPYQQRVPAWGDFLVFYLTKNPGAAFSLGTGVTWLFTIILSVAALVVVVLLVVKVRSRLWAVALGLLLGGVLGNLTDRVTREPGFPVGHVIDFIYTPWMMPAIYNVADMFVVTTMIAIALMILLGLHLDGSRERRSKDGDDVATPVEEADADEASAAVSSTRAEARRRRSVAGATQVDSMTQEDDVTQSPDRARGDSPDAEDTQETPAEEAATTAGATTDAATTDAATTDDAAAAPADADVEPGADAQVAAVLDPSGELAQETATAGPEDPARADDAVSDPSGELGAEDRETDTSSEQP